MSEKLQDEDVVVDDVDADDIEQPDDVDQSEADVDEGAEEVEEPKEDGEEEQEQDGELTVTIGDAPEPEAPSSSVPDWVRDLRRANREKERRIKELEAKLQAGGKLESKVTLGPKPKLEDYDYDSDKFESAVSDWYERKLIVDKEIEATKAQEREQEASWKEKLAKYSDAKSKLNVGDYEDAEEFVQDVLNVTQQGIILQGAKRPELVVYALGKNPKKAKELAGIKNPVDFAFAVSDLEKELKVATKKSLPQPERVIKGNGRASGLSSNKLDELRAKAEKTGDYTEVIKYKQKLKLSGKD